MVSWRKEGNSLRAGSGTGLALALDLGFIIAPASMVWENIGYFRSGHGSWHAMDPKWIRMELTFFAGINLLCLLCFVCFFICVS